MTASALTSAVTRTRRGSATTERLLDAAEAELLATGGTLEVARVAARAGVSTGLLYRYFDRKGGLAAAVVHRCYDRYDAAVFTTAGADTGLGWLRAERDRLAREIDFWFDEPLARIVLTGRLREPAAAQADAERLTDQIALATRNVRAAQRAGALPAHLDAELAAAAILGAFRTVVAAALRREEPPARAEVLRLLVELSGTVLGVPTD